MKENRNIEDIFRKAAEKYKVEPDQKVWNNVEKEIWNNNFFNRLHEILSKYSVVPGTHVWNNVQRKLAYLMFFRFNWTSFNIYYASAVLIIAGSLFVMNDFSDETIVKGQIAQNNYPELSVNREITNKNEAIDSEILSTLVSGLNEENLVANSKINTVQTNNELTKVSNNQISNNHLNNNGIISETTTNKQGHSNIIEKQETNVIEEPILVDKTDEKSPNNFEKPVSKENFNSNLNNEKLFSKFEVKLSGIVPADEKSSLIVEQSELKTDSLWLANNIIPYKDTVGKDAQGNDIIIETTHWSADVFWSSFVSKSNFTSTNPESNFNAGLRNFADQKTTNLKNFGVNINYSFKQLIVQSGFEYTEIQNSNLLETKFESIEARTEQAIFATSDFYVDTYTFQNLDSLLAGVNYDITVHDTIWQSGLDTVNYVVYDTIYNKTTVETKGTYSYLEVPLIIGYEFQRRNFVITPKAGLIAGVLIKTGGYQPGFSDFTVPQTISKGNYQNLQFAAYFSIGFSYKIGNRFEAIADPYLRYSLNSMTRKETGLNQKLSATGIKLGLRYYFNE